MAATRTKRLKIGIVGAGIAGLSAAVALSQSGHEIDVFEKSTLAYEVGAAVTACPNAARVLHHWGFEFDKWLPTEAKGFKIADAERGVLQEHSFEGFEQSYGFKIYLYHRVDLHSGLKDHAQRLGVKVYVDSEVESIDDGAGVLTLKNGATYEKDLIVVADGIHTRFVSSVNGAESKIIETGMQAYRWLIPTQELLSNPKTRQFMKESIQGWNMLTVSNDKRKRLIWYPCREGTLMNFVGMHPADNCSEKGEGWAKKVNISDLLRTFSAADQDVLEVCRCAQDLKVWSLNYREPLQRWHSGKVVLIGDAAHPMLPHHGQGGAMAIEDTGALGVLFDGVNAQDDLRCRLQLFEDVRKKRASAIQIMSNAGQDQMAESEAKIQPYFEGPVPKTLREIQDFSYSHDVIRASQEALASYNSKLECVE